MHAILSVYNIISCTMYVYIKITGSANNYSLMWVPIDGSSSAAVNQASQAMAGSGGIVWPGPLTLPSSSSSSSTPPSTTSTATTSTLPGNMRRFLLSSRFYPVACMCTAGLSNRFCLSVCLSASCIQIPLERSISASACIHMVGIGRKTY